MLNIFRNCHSTNLKDLSWGQESKDIFIPTLCIINPPVAGPPVFSLCLGEVNGVESRIQRIVGIEAEQLVIRWQPPDLLNPFI